MKFTEENILKIFGNEAAESEDQGRLREYYFKSPVYDQVTSKVPLRILVGHKGIGKSALFCVSEQENYENGIVPIRIRPDDVIGIAEEDWKRKEWR